MAFDKSYLGDQVATGVLIPTIQGISGIIPGVTVKPELAGLIGAEKADFWYDLAPAVEEADAGDDFDTAQVGSKKATIVMTKALHADEKIPQVAIDTISVDIVGAKTLQLATAIGNGLGKRFYNNLVGLAQKKTYTNGEGMVDAIAEGIKTFSEGASAKIDGVTSDGAGGNPAAFSNATNGILPTTVVVSTAGLKKLRQDASFKDLFNGTGALPGTVGTLFGLQVVYSQHLDTIDVISGTAGTQPAEFVLLNFQGVAFPYSLNMLRAIPSENFNGVRLQAEVVYPDHDEPSVLVIDSFAMAFTEAAA
jgi:hypothetical protein